MIRDTVKVGCYDYKVQLVKEPPILNDHVMAGIIDYRGRIININAKQGINDLEETWWHEIIHAITDERGIDLGEEYEEVVESLAHGLYGLMKDNKYLLPGQTEECLHGVPETSVS